MNVVQELQQELSTFWWVDSSVRWLTSNLSEVYDAVSNGRVGSYLTVDKAHHSMFAATHPSEQMILHHLKAHNFSHVQISSH
jgi:hypothetical protein